MKNRKFTITVILVAVFFLSSMGNAAEIFHSNIGGSCVYSTKTTPNTTKELFCLDPATEAVYGIGYFSGKIYVAINRGSDIWVQVRKKANGKLKKEFLVSINSLLPNDSIFDFAFARKSFYAASANKIIHCDMKGNIDTVFFPPPGNLVAGLTYNKKTKVLYALLVDQSVPGNPSSIASYDTVGNMIMDPVSLPNELWNNPYFGLCVDKKRKTFWTSTSYAPFLDYIHQDHLIEVKIKEELNDAGEVVSRQSEVVRTLPIEHAYGSVECQ